MSARGLVSDLATLDITQGFRLFHILKSAHRVSDIEG